MTTIKRLCKHTDFNFPPHERNKMIQHFIKLLLLLGCTTLQAQSVTIKGLTTCKSQEVIILDSSSSVGTHQKWITPDGCMTLAGTNGLAISFTLPGKKEIHLVSSSTDGIAIGSWIIDVVDSGFNPLPNPTPTPTPLNPAPIPYPGFRVLMTYDSALGVPESMTAKVVRDYLNTHCVKGPNNKTMEYRVWDVNVDTTETIPMWQDAMNRPKPTQPWIIISDGKTGYEGPAPKTTTEMLSLLKKYGGA